MLYTNGDDEVDAAPRKAVYWFRKLADAGNAIGMLNLGLFYAKAAPAQQPANRSQAQDNARKEAERQAQEQQRQKKAQENRRRQEEEAKRFDDEIRQLTQQEKAKLIPKFDQQLAICDKVLKNYRRYTINEMMAAVPALGNLTNQRVSAIVRQLTLTGEVIRTEENRIFYFEIGD